MKRLLYFFILLISFNASAQYNYIGGKSVIAFAQGGLRADGPIYIGQDTVLPAGWPRNIPAIASKNDVLYRWSVSAQKWVPSGVSSWSDLTGKPTEFTPAAGSGYYVRNGTASQTGDFNLTGSGTAGRFIAQQANPYITLNNVGGTTKFIQFQDNGVTTHSFGANNSNGWFQITTASRTMFNNVFNSASPALQILTDVDGGGIRLGSRTTDGSGANGDLFYRSDLDKLRAYIGGLHQNVATEAWVLNTIQAGLVVTVDKSNPNATDTRTNISRYSITAPFKTIAAAKAAAQGGDIMLVKNGTYNEAIQYHFSTDLKFLQLWIFENATVNGGALPAFSGEGNLDIKIFLNNSRLINTGNTADRANTSAVQMSTMRINIYGNAKALAIISSQESAAIGGSSNDVTTFETLSLSSTNYFGYAGIYNSGSIVFKNCNLTSVNSTALAGYGGYAENCTIKGGVSAYRMSGSAGGGFCNTYTFINCIMEGTGGYGIEGVTNVSVCNGLGTLRNCTITSKYETIKTQSANVTVASNLLLENNKFIITDTSVQFAIVQTAGGYNTGTIKTINTISNVPLFSPTYLAAWNGSTSSTMADVVKEVNTSVQDKSVFFGVRTMLSQLNLSKQYTPTGTSDPNGSIGDITHDDNYIYKKDASGWKRSALFTTF